MKKKSKIDCKIAELKRLSKKIPELENVLLHTLISVSCRGGIYMLGIPFRFKKAWERFYLEIFEMKVSFKETEIPKSDKTKNLTFPVLIAGGVDRNLLLRKAKELINFSTIREDLNLLLRGNEDREPDHNYAIRIRPFAFADIEHRNKSIKEIRQKGIMGITFTEMLILHLFLQFIGKYADSVCFAYGDGNTLDTQSATLCSGSYPSKSPSESSIFEIYISQTHNHPHMQWQDDTFAREWFAIREVKEK